MLRHHKRDENGEFYTRERCFITEVLNCSDSADLSIARCRVEVGVTTELHSLKDIVETYYIEKGEGMMDDGQSTPFKVGAGDCVTIPENQAQRIQNSGQEDLVFMVVCRPRFTPEKYQPLE